jgi:glycosyltransferase involved in cell wall biosynthesis
MKNIYAISGSGAIGEDPLDPTSWSGSSAFFFREIESRGRLRGTVGGEIPKWQKALLALLNYSPDYSIMRERTYTDVRYRNALSRLLEKQVKAIDFCPDSASIQLGTMFNLHTALGDQCVRTTYNDSNTIMWTQSPHFPGVHFSTKQIDAAIQYEKKVLDGMHMIFTMSEYLRQSFINDYGAPEDKVFCIGTGMNLSESVIKEATDFDVSTKRYDTQEILFIGVDFRRKGGDSLIAAFRKVRSVFPKSTLHIVGSSKAVADYDSEAGVFWHGFLKKNVPQDAEKLKSLFCQSSLFVMPSIYEPFGIAPLEAMLHGIPCVVSNRWALPEVVAEGETGELVEPGNEEMLAEKMIHLLGNPELLRTYGLAGKPWVLNNFLWHKVVDRLEVCLNRTT